MFSLIIFVIGIIIGSFLNVAVYRSRIGETIAKGRSHCPSCKKILCWYELIPVISFLLQVGKCRKCKSKISWQYPVVEIFTGVAFLLGWQFYLSEQVFHSSGLFWIHAVLVLFWIATLVAIFVYDWKYLEIPNSFLYCGIVFSVAVAIIKDIDLFFSSGLSAVFNGAVISGVLGALVAGGFFFILVAVSHETWMGKGDIYIGAIIGMVIGWPWILEALMISFTFGAIFGMILMLLKGKNLKTKIAFGPFLVLGGMMTLLWGQKLFDLYLKLFN